MEVLINLVTRSWRYDIIDHVFGVAEADVIKSIPISSSSQPDVLVWPFTLSGQYSIKSGYKFLQENLAIAQIPTQELAF